MRFGATWALDRVSLRIGRGECVAFIGPSGSGKTTLLRLLNGTVRVMAGEVRADGEAIALLSPRRLRALRARIGFVHQDLSLVPNLRVIQNVISGTLGRRSLASSMRSMVIPSRREAIAVHRILDRVGIGEKLYDRTDRLSGGQQQRVAIARALHQEPVAILADEPVSSVDPPRARDTVMLLTEIARERGLTLGMSLHNLDLAVEFFPRLVGLRRGRVIFDKPSAEVDDEELRSLYRLERHELLEDGAGG